MPLDRKQYHKGHDEKTERIFGNEGARDGPRSSRRGSGDGEVAREARRGGDGDRPSERVIQDRVLDPLSMELIEGRIVDGDTITIDVAKGEVVFAKGKPKKGK